MPGARQKIRKVAPDNECYGVYYASPWARLPSRAGTPVGPEPQGGAAFKKPCINSSSWGSVLSLFGGNKASSTQDNFTSLARLDGGDNEFSSTWDSGLHDASQHGQRRSVSKDAPAPFSELILETHERNSFLVHVCHEGDLMATQTSNSSPKKDGQHMALDTFRRKSTEVLRGQQKALEKADSEKPQQGGDGGTGTRWKNDPWAELSRQMRKKFQKPKRKEVLQIIQEFGRFRLDGNCDIGLEEFKELLHVLVKIPTIFDIPDEWVNRFWIELDVDQSGTADAQEILLWYNRHFGQAQVERSPESCADQFYRSIPGVHVKQFSMGAHGLEWSGVEVTHAHLQAHLLGVKKGWKIMSVDGMECIDSIEVRDRLRFAMRKAVPYTIMFMDYVPASGVQFINRTAAHKVAALCKVGGIQNAGGNSDAGHGKASEPTTKKVVNVFAALSHMKPKKSLALKQQGGAINNKDSKESKLDIKALSKTIETKIQYLQKSDEVTAAMVDSMCVACAELLLGFKSASDLEKWQKLVEILQDEEGDIREVQNLIDVGANLLQRDPLGNVPLHYAQTSAMFELLIAEEPLAGQVRNTNGLKPISTFLSRKAVQGADDLALLRTLHTYSLVELLTTNIHGVSPAMRVQSKELENSLKARLPPWHDVKDALCFAKTDVDLKLREESFAKACGLPVERFWYLVLPFFCFANAYQAGRHNKYSRHRLLVVCTCIKRLIRILGKKADDDVVTLLRDLLASTRGPRMLAKQSVTSWDPRRPIRRQLNSMVDQLWEIVSPTMEIEYERLTETAAAEWLKQELSSYIHPGLIPDQLLQTGLAKGDVPPDWLRLRMDFLFEPDPDGAKFVPLPVPYWTRRRNLKQTLESLQDVNLAMTGDAAYELLLYGRDPILPSIGAKTRSSIGQQKHSILSPAQLAESYWYAAWLRGYCTRALPEVTTKLREIIIQAFGPNERPASASAASFASSGVNPSADDGSVEDDAFDQELNANFDFQKHGLEFHSCSEAKSFEYICEKMIDAHDEYLDLCPQVKNDDELKYHVITAANVVTDILSYTLIVDSATKLHQGYKKLMSYTWQEHGAEVLRVQNHFHQDAYDFGSCRHLKVWLAIHLVETNTLLPVQIDFYLEAFYKHKAKIDLPFDYIEGSLDWQGAHTASAEPYENVVVRRQMAVSLKAEKKIWSDAAIFTMDGDRLLVGCNDCAVRIWNVASGVCMQSWVEHRAAVVSVACSPDGVHFASGSLDKTAKIWNLNTGKIVNMLAGHEDSILSIAYHPDAHQLATGSADRTVRIWEASSGICDRSLMHSKSPVCAVAYSPDGSHLVAASQDRSIQIWGTEYWDKFRELQGHKGSVTTVAFHPDGDTLASGSQDCSIKFWSWRDTAAREAEKTLSGHKDAVTGIAYSADWERLASASADAQVRVWSVEDGVCLQILGGQDSDIVAVACSPYGDHFATCSKDETIRIWGCK